MSEGRDQLAPLSARRVRKTMSSTGQRAPAASSSPARSQPKESMSRLWWQGEVMQSARHRRHAEHGVPLDCTKQLDGEFGLADPIEGDRTARQSVPLL